MTVMIKDMEMPNSCMDCDFMGRHDSFADGCPCDLTTKNIPEDVILSFSRPDWCLLVEVPDSMQQKESMMKSTPKNEPIIADDVIQFLEGHPWAGCIGIVSEDLGEGKKDRYLIGVHSPNKDVFYIFDDGSQIARIGPAVLPETYRSELENKEGRFR